MSAEQSDGSIPTITQIEKTQSNNTKIEGKQVGSRLKVKATNSRDTIYIKIPTYVEKSGSKSVQTICPTLFGQDYFYWAGWLFHLVALMGLLAGLIYYRNSTRDAKSPTV